MRLEHTRGWIFGFLGTSRPIDAGDAASLTDLGDSYGVDVLILDWSDDALAIPTLAVLCACAPDAVALHLGSSAKHRHSGRRGRLLLRREKREELLKRLKSSCVSLQAARTRCRDWALAEMRTKENAAGRSTVSQPSKRLGS